MKRFVRNSDPHCTSNVSRIGMISQHFFQENEKRVSACEWSVGDKVMWLSFSKFSDSMIVAKLENENIFRDISKVLQQTEKETLKQAPVVGQVKAEIIHK